MDRFGSRRVWENSQRGCLILRHPKSYLPTHSVIHKSAIRVLAIFADASRTGYAEAKRFTNGLCVTFARDASRTGYAEAKLCRLVELAGVADASRTGYAEAKSHCQPSCSTPVEDASRTGYCARQKQTSAARQEIFECVEKQNQWH